MGEVRIRGAHRRAMPRSEARASADRGGESRNRVRNGDAESEAVRDREALEGGEGGLRARAGGETGGRGGEGGDRGDLGEDPMNIAQAMEEGSWDPERAERILAQFLRSANVRGAAIVLAS